MSRARVEVRDRQDALVHAESPSCPQCGDPMRKRRSARGPFWGCARYPDCKGVRSLEAETKEEQRAESSEERTR